MRRQQVAANSRLSSQAKYPNVLQSDSKPTLLRPSTHGAKLKYHNKPWRQDSGSLSIQKIGESSTSNSE